METDRQTDRLREIYIQLSGNTLHIYTSLLLSEASHSDLDIKPLSEWVSFTEKGGGLVTADVQLSSCKHEDSGNNNGDKGRNGAFLNVPWLTNRICSSLRQQTTESACEELWPQTNRSDRLPCWICAFITAYLKDYIMAALNMEHCGIHT